MSLPDSYPYTSHAFRRNEPTEHTHRLSWIAAFNSENISNAPPEAFFTWKNYMGIIINISYNKEKDIYIGICLAIRIVG